MRLLMLVAVVCFVIALLGQVNVISGVDVLAWALAAWLAWSVDVALGARSIVVPVDRRAP